MSNADDDHLFSNTLRPSLPIVSSKDDVFENWGISERDLEWNNFKLLSTSDTGVDVLTGFSA